MTKHVFPEIITRLSSAAIQSKLITADDASLVADLFIELIRRKQLDIHLEEANDGIITDLFVRMIDIVAHCDRSPTYEGQEIEAMVLNKIVPSIQ